MEGAFSRGYSLADVVKGLYVGRRSGVLEVTQGKTRKRLYFQKGSLTFSDCTDPEWRLGALLVKRGLITEADLAHVLNLLAPAKRIGAVMTGLGLITEAQLNAAVEFQITENVFPAFVWTDGSFTFHEMDDAAPADIAFTISTANVIMEGIRRIQDDELVAAAVGPLDQVVLLGANPLLRFQAVALKPKEGFILSRIDGLLTVEEVCSISPVPQEEVLRCLYGLKSAGILEIHGRTETRAESEAAGDIAGFFLDFGGTEELLGARPTTSDASSAGVEEDRELVEIREFSERMRAMDHYSVLGVEATADEKTIRRAYYRLAKKYHPDRHHRSHLSDLQDRLEAIFVRVNEAYETLQSSDRRTAYDRGLRGGAAASREESGQREGERAADPQVESARRQQTAESAYRDARHFLEQGDIFAAIRVFRHAVNNQPENATYRSYLGRTLGQNPKWRKEAEEHLLKAIELEPSQGEHYAQLGQLYQVANLTSKAERYFTEALRWDPGNDTARKGRGRGDDKKGQGQGRGGAFRSLFGDKGKD